MASYRERLLLSGIFPDSEDDDDEDGDEDDGDHHLGRNQSLNANNTSRTSTTTTTTKNNANNSSITSKNRASGRSSLQQENQIDGTKKRKRQHEGVAAPRDIIVIDSDDDDEEDDEEDYVDTSRHNNERGPRSSGRGGGHSRSQASSSSARPQRATSPDPPPPPRGSSSDQQQQQQQQQQPQGQRQETDDVIDLTESPKKRQQPSKSNSNNKVNDTAPTVAVAAAAQQSKMKKPKFRPVPTSKLKKPPPPPTPPLSTATETEAKKNSQSVAAGTKTLRTGTKQTRSNSSSKPVVPVDTKKKPTPLQSSNPIITKTKKNSNKTTKKKKSKDQQAQQKVDEEKISRKTKKKNEKKQGSKNKNDNHLLLHAKKPSVKTLSTKPSAAIQAHKNHNKNDRGGDRTHHDSHQQHLQHPHQQHHHPQRQRQQQGANIRIETRNKSESSSRPVEGRSIHNNNSNNHSRSSDDIIMCRYGVFCRRHDCPFKHDMARLCEQRPPQPPPSFRTDSNLNRRWPPTPPPPPPPPPSKSDHRNLNWWEGSDGKSNDISRDHPRWSEEKKDDRSLHHQPAHDHPRKRMRHEEHHTAMSEAKAAATYFDSISGTWQFDTTFDTRNSNNNRRWEPSVPPPPPPPPSNRQQNAHEHYHFDRSNRWLSHSGTESTSDRQHKTRGPPEVSDNRDPRSHFHETVRNVDLGHANLMKRPDMVENSVDHLVRTHRDNNHSVQIPEHGFFLRKSTTLPRYVDMDRLSGPHPNLKAPDRTRNHDPTHRNEVNLNAATTTRAGKQSEYPRGHDEKAILSKRLSDPQKSSANERNEMILKNPQQERQQEIDNQEKSKELELLPSVPADEPEAEEPTDIVNEKTIREIMEYADIKHYPRMRGREYAIKHKFSRGFAFIGQSKREVALQIEIRHKEEWREVVPSKQMGDTPSEYPEDSNCNSVSDNIQMSDTSLSRSVKAQSQGKSSSNDNGDSSDHESSTIIDLLSSTNKSMILEAIAALKDRKGSSMPAINNWIKSEKNKTIKNHVLRATLKRGIESGEFVRVKAKTPRYKLSPEGKKTLKLKQKKHDLEKRTVDYETISVREKSAQKNEERSVVVQKIDAQSSASSARPTNAAESPTFPKGGREESNENVLPTGNGVVKSEADSTNDTAEDHPSRRREQTCAFASNPPVNASNESSSDEDEFNDYDLEKKLDRLVNSNHQYSDDSDDEDAELDKKFERLLKGASKSNETETEKITGNSLGKKPDSIKCKTEFKQPMQTPSMSSCGFADSEIATTEAVADITTELAGGNEEEKAEMRTIQPSEAIRNLYHQKPRDTKIDINTHYLQFAAKRGKPRSFSAIFLCPLTHEGFLAGPFGSPDEYIKDVFNVGKKDECALYWYDTPYKAKQAAAAQAWNCIMMREGKASEHFFGDSRPYWPFERPTWPVHCIPSDVLDTLSPEYRKTKQGKNSREPFFSASTKKLSIKDGTQTGIRDENQEWHRILRNWRGQRDTAKGVVADLRANAASFESKRKHAEKLQFYTTKLALLQEALNVFLKLIDDGICSKQEVAEFVVPDIRDLINSSLDNFDNKTSMSVSEQISRYVSSLAEVSNDSRLACTIAKKCLKTGISHNSIIADCPADRAPLPGSTPDSERNSLQKDRHQTQQDREEETSNEAEDFPIFAEQSSSSAAASNNSSTDPQEEPNDKNEVVQQQTSSGTKESCSTFNVSRELPKTAKPIFKPKKRQRTAKVSAPLTSSTDAKCGKIDRVEHTIDGTVEQIRDTNAIENRAVKDCLGSKKDLSVNSHDNASKNQESPADSETASLQAKERRYVFCQAASAAPVASAAMGTGTTGHAPLDESDKTCGKRRRRVFNKESDYGFFVSEKEAEAEQEKLFAAAAARMRTQAKARISHDSLPSLPTKTIVHEPLFSVPVQNIHEGFPDHWRYNNLYSRLGLPPSATDIQIKTHYRQLARIYHPDKGGEELKFQEVTEAYNLLMNR